MVRIRVYLFVLCAFVCGFGTLAPAEKGGFEADWDSLRGHEEAPEWFRDAKFGIYFHWGVSCSR